jgi:hypothetical protein
MVQKLIFLSNDRKHGSLKLNFAILMSAIVLTTFGFTQFIPSVIQQNGTEVFPTRIEKTYEQKGYQLIPANLSTRQYELLNFAYDTAKKDGFKNPEYLQGVILQESNAGANPQDYRVAGDHKIKENEYYGIGQIKLQTALHVMKNFPDMWMFLETRSPEEVKARLILDDFFNIRVASKYLLLMGINNSPLKAITSYNVGVGGAKEIENYSIVPYTKAVISHASSPTIKKVNKEKF